MKEQAKFDHSQRNIFQACGISKDEAVDAMDKVSQVTMYCATQQVVYGNYGLSRAVEQIFEQLSERQLFIYCMYLMRKDIDEAQTPDK